MLPFKYPYTNFHEINLDWILETVKSNTDRIAKNELNIKLMGGDDPLNSLHPVGSIFISAENTSPASMFGGTWEQLKDRFLLGAGDSYAAGSTGGEATHTLTINEIPGHQHGPITLGADSQNIIQWMSNSQNGSKNEWGLAYSTEMLGNALYSGYAGGGGAHNNMPPYLAVHMWKRVG